MLRTDLRTRAAADAGRRLCFLRQSIDQHAVHNRRAEFRVVIDLQKVWNIQLHRAAVTAVTASGAWHDIHHAPRDIRQQSLLCLAEPLKMAECFEIVLYLLHAAHTAKHDGNVRQTADKSECPGRNGVLRTQSFHLLLVGRVQRCQAAASAWLHHDW